MLLVAVSLERVQGQEYIRLSRLNPLPRDEGWGSMPRRCSVWNLVVIDNCMDVDFSMPVLRIYYAVKVLGNHYP